MDWGVIGSIALLAGIGLFIWGMAKLEPTPEEKREAKAARRVEAQRQRSALVCPHCDTAGQVFPSAVVRKQGISGGKATGALFTGGASMLVTGLSRKQRATEMRCGNCGTTWDVA